MDNATSEHFVNPSTIVFVALFFFLYGGYFFHKVMQRKLDVYDFFMLSTVGLIPTCFVLFPGVVLGATHLIGIKFPFLLLFGALFVILFIISYSVIRRVNTLSQKLINVVQEVGILSVSNSVRVNRVAEGTEKPLDV